MSRPLVEAAAELTSHMAGYSTFSILAADPGPGELGIAMASKLPCVGSFCPVIRPGLAAVVTQAWTNPYLPGRVLDRLAAGDAPEPALAAVMTSETEAGLRQVAVVDQEGRAAAFTGTDVEPVFGQRIGDGFVVLGNMLPDLEVLEAMAEAFMRGPGMALALRLLAALEAGAAAGGDVRGTRSAALKVMAGEIYPRADLRADDHDRPVEELGRLYRAAARDLFPFIAALPTRANPRGRFEDVRDQVRPRR